MVYPIRDHYLLLQMISSIGLFQLKEPCNREQKNM